jgi:hypothetical protein
MCTVTVVPYEQGVRLLSNRDERHDRPAALPPQIEDLAGRRAIFPVDPQGGGTWVGVNDAGVAVTLLNVQKTTCAGDGRPKQSRGLVVRALLHSTSLRDAAAAVEAFDPRAFEPFQVVIVHDGRVVGARSDGAAPIRITEWPLDKPLLFTSSSLGDARVLKPRQQLFERMVVRSHDGWLKGQARFHDHQWAARPEISVRMERDDALTVSRTTIDVTNDTRELLYEAPQHRSSLV